MKSIYEEALEDLYYVIPVGYPKDMIGKTIQTKRLLDFVKHAQKQEKLLEMYRQLSQDLGLIIEYDTTDTWAGPEDYEYLEINEDIPKALNTYKQIKELENDE